MLLTMTAEEYKFSPDSVKSSENTKSRVILASGSKNRQLLLNLLGIPFEVIPSYIDEKSIQEENPIQKVQKIALLKASQVSSQHEGIIIAADTFAVINNEHYEKPTNLDEAKRMLLKLSGQTLKSLTGICVINTARRTTRVTYKAIDIQVADLTDDIIEQYITTKPVTEWATAYNPLDEFSTQLFHSVNEYTNGLEYGLPLDIVVEELRAANISLDPLLIEKVQRRSK